MDQVLTNPQASLEAVSPLARFSQLDKSEFRAAVEQKGAALEAVHEVITQQVESGQITPAEGLGWIACTTGQAFGYAEFHGQPGPSDVVLRAIASGNGRS